MTDKQRKFIKLFVKGITQDDMSAELNVTTRTIRYWKKDLSKEIIKAQEVTALRNKMRGFSEYIPFEIPSINKCEKCGKEVNVTPKNSKVTSRKIKILVSTRCENCRNTSNKPKEAYYRISEVTWKDSLAHFNYRCAYCGSSEDLCRDHAIARAEGGNDFCGNVLPACRSCNSSKSDKDVVTWFKKHPKYSAEKLIRILEFLWLSSQKRVKNELQEVS